MKLFWGTAVPLFNPFRDLLFRAILTQSLNESWSDQPKRSSLADTALLCIQIFTPLSRQWYHSAAESKFVKFMTRGLAQDCKIMKLFL